MPIRNIIGRSKITQSPQIPQYMTNVDHNNSPFLMNQDYKTFV